MTKPTWNEILVLHKDKFKISSTGCWLWIRALNGGYAWVAVGDHKSKLAHVVFYEAKYNITIPNGFESHHTCRVKRCVNPEHIEIKKKSTHLSEHKTRKPIIQEQLEKAIELYKKGFSLRWLARKFTIRSATLRIAIKENGINIRPKHITDYAKHIF